MTVNETFDALVRQLRKADDQTLLKIVGVVDRLAKRGPLDKLLDQHRLRLARIRPPRPMTPERLFVLPFEELLVDGRVWSQGMMRVPRDRLSRLIALTFVRLDRDLVAALRDRLKGRTMDDASLILEIGRELWPACATAVGGVLDSGRQSRDPETRELQLPLRIAQHLLPVAEAVVTTVWALPPKPMLELDKAAQEQIAHLLGLAAAAGKDCFQLVAELLVNRSELPLSIIEPVLSGDFEWGVRERQQAAAMVAEACQSDMVRLFRSIAETSESSEPRDLLPPLQSIVSNLESLLDVTTKIKFDHRALRKLKTETFELILARVGHALDEQLLPAFERLDDAEAEIDWRRLEQNAAAAANLRLMAKRIGLATKIDFVFSRALERYRTVLQPAEPGIAGRALLDPVVMDRVRIIELLFGSRAAMQVLAPFRSGDPRDFDDARHRHDRAKPATRAA